MNRELAIILKLQNQVSKELEKVNADINKSGKTAGMAGSAFGVLGTGIKIAGAAAIAAAAAIIPLGLQTASTLETAEIGLKTLLGSAEKATDTIKRLKVESARTPFELPGLAQATQLLTSVTKDGNKSIDIILDIGEGLAAMGKGQAELDRIIINLQQIAATGKAATIDIKQFAFAGIPIYEMLAQTTGKTGEALATFIEEGGVTFELLTRMFDEANNAGGRFFNAYVNNAGSFAQATSNLKDSWGLFAADIVNNTGIFSGLTDAMLAAAGALTNYKSILSTTGETVSGWLSQLDQNTGLVTLLKEAWDNLVFVYENSLKPALEELWVALQPYMPFLKELAKVFGTMLVIAIGAVILVVSALLTALTGLITFITKSVTKTLNSVAGVFDTITTAISKVIDKVDKAYSSFKKLVSLAKDAGGDWISKAIGKVFSVDDAIISPDGNIITTHPDDYIIATKDPSSLMGGGGINITISGNTLLDSRSAEKIGDLIVQRLKLNYQQ